MAVLLATFLSTVRGVRFYDVSVSSVRAGGRVALQLEPTNIYDSNCVALPVAVYLRSSLFSDMLGHLAREDAAYLAPLLRSGLFATFEIALELENISNNLEL